MEDRKLRNKWLFFAVSGLVLIGFGLSVMGEALIQKLQNQGFNSWFWIGTISLILINTGLSFFGKAITLRVRLDDKNKT